MTNLAIREAIVRWRKHSWTTEGSAMLEALETMVERYEDLDAKLGATAMILIKLRAENEDLRKQIERGSDDF